MSERENVRESEEGVADRTLIDSVAFAVRGRAPVGGGSSSRWEWRRAIAEQAREVRTTLQCEVSRTALFAFEVVFSLLPLRAHSADIDNLARPVLNTLFDSRDEQADRTLTATLFDAEDAQIWWLVAEKRLVEDPADEGIEVVVRWQASEIVAE
jgi:hypothetical protein